MGGDGRNSVIPWARSRLRPRKGIGTVCGGARIPTIPGVDGRTHPRSFITLGHAHGGNWAK